MRVTFTTPRSGPRARPGTAAVARAGGDAAPNAGTGPGPARPANRAEVPFPQLFGDEPCQRDGVNPETFWPEGPDAEDRTAAAKRLCDDCRTTTRLECLAWTLANPALAGGAIWGGLTADERRAEIGRRQQEHAARIRRDRWSRPGVVPL